MSSILDQMRKEELGNIKGFDAAAEMQVKSFFDDDPEAAPVEEDQDLRIGSAIEAASKKYGVPEARIRAHIAQESSFNPNAKNPKSSAAGLMQMTKGALKAVGAEGIDPFNIEDNVEAGTAYLAKLNTRYDGDWDAASHAYHHGSLEIHPKGDPDYLAKINEKTAMYESVKPLPDIPAPPGGAPETMTPMKQEVATQADQNRPDYSASRLVGAAWEGLHADVPRSFVLGTGALLSSQVMTSEKASRILAEYEAGNKVALMDMARDGRMSEDETLRMVNDIASNPEFLGNKISQAGSDLIKYGFTAEWLEANPEYFQSAGWWEDLVRATPQMAAQILITAGASAIGGPSAGAAAGMAFMGPQVMGGTYESLIKAGVPHEQAAQEAFRVMLISVPLEQIGISKTASLFGVRKLIQKRLMTLAETSAAEGITEFLQTYPEAAAQLVAKNPDADFIKRFAEVTEDPEVFMEALHNGSIGATLGLVAGGVGVARQEAARKQSENQQKLVEELTEKPVTKKKEPAKKKPAKKKVNKELEQLKANRLKAEKKGQTDEKKPKETRQQTPPPTKAPKDKKETPKETKPTVEEKVPTAAEQLARAKELREEAKDVEKALKIPGIRVDAKMNEEEHGMKGLQVTITDKNSPAYKNTIPVMANDKGQISKKMVEDAIKKSEEQSAKAKEPKTVAEDDKVLADMKTDLEKNLIPGITIKPTKDEIPGAYDVYQEGDLIDRAATAETVASNYTVKAEKAPKEAKPKVKKPVAKATAFTDMENLVIQATDADGKTVNIEAGKLSEGFNPSKPQSFIEEADKLYRAAEKKAKEAGYTVDKKGRGFKTRGGKLLKINELGKSGLKKKLKELRTKAIKKTHEKILKTLNDQDQRAKDIESKRSKELKRMRTPNEADKAFFAEVEKAGEWAARSISKQALSDQGLTQDYAQEAKAKIWAWIRKTPAKDVARWVSNKDKTVSKRALAKDIAYWHLNNQVMDRIAKMNDTNRNKLRTLIEKGKTINTEEPTATGSVENVSVEGTDTGVPEEGSTTSRTSFKKMRSNMSPKRKAAVASGEVKRYKGKRAERQYKRAQRRLAAKKEAAIRVEKARAKKTALGKKKPSEKSNKMERRSALEQSKAAKIAAEKALVAGPSLGSVSEERDRIKLSTPTKTELNVTLDALDNLVLERKGTEGGEKRLSKAERRALEGPKPIAKREVVVMTEQGSPLEQAGKKGIPEYKNVGELKKEFKAFSPKRVEDPKQLEKFVDSNVRIFKIGNKYGIGTPGLQDAVKVTDDPMIMVSPMSSGKHAKKAADYIKELDKQISDKSDPYYFLHEFNLRNGVNYVFFDSFKTLQNSNFWKNLPVARQANWAKRWKEGTMGLHSVISNAKKTERYVFVNLSTGRTLQNNEVTVRHEAVHAFETIQVEKLPEAERKEYYAVQAKLYKTYKAQIHAVARQDKGKEAMVRWRSFFDQVEDNKGINAKEITAYLWSDPTIAAGLNKVMTQYMLKDGTVVRKSFWRRMTEAVLGTILPQGMKRKATYMEAATRVAENYLGITPHELTKAEMSSQGLATRSIYSMREVQEIPIETQEPLDVGDENIHEVLEDLQNLDFKVDLSKEAPIDKTDKKSDEYVKETIDSKAKLPKGKSVPAKVAHGVADLLDIEAPWKRIGADKVGNVLKRFFSIKSAQQIQGVKEAEKIVKVARAIYGKKATRKLMGQSLLAYEDINYLEKNFNKAERQKMQPLLQAYDDFFKYTEAIYKARGIEFNFKERMLAEIEQKMAQTHPGEKMQKLIDKWDQVNRSEYVHIPIRVLFQEALQKKFVQMKVGTDAKKNVEKALKLLNDKKRRTTTLTSMVENEKTPIDVAHINPVEIMMNYMHRFSKDMAVLDIRDELVAANLASPKKGKGRKPKGKQYEGKQFVFIGDKGTPAYTTALKNHWVEAGALDALNNLLSIEERQNVYDKAVAFAKMSSFYNPLFLPFYDTYQSLMSGAVFAQHPGKTATNMFKAVKHTMMQDGEYMKAMNSGLFSKPFDFPWKSYKEQMSRVTRLGHQKGLTGWLSNNAMEAIQIAARNKGVNPLNYITAFYNISWNIAWKLDETVRMFTYLQLKGKKGWDAPKAAEVAANFHGDYASVPPKTRKWLNRVLFTPTFKIVMGKLYYNMAKGMLKTAVGTQTKQEQQYATGLMSLAALTFAFDAVMRSLGYEPDEGKWWNIGRSYRKEIDSEWGPRYMHFTWSNPGNLLQRYTQRVMRQDWDTNPMKALWNTIKWDMNPAWQTIASASNGRYPDGTQIVYDNDSAKTKRIKWAKFFVTDVIDVFNAIPSLKEWQRTITPEGQRQAKAYEEENFHEVAKWFTDGILAIFSTYTSPTDLQKIKMKSSKMKRQFIRDQKDYMKQHDEINDEWLEEYLTKMEELAEELEEIE